MFIYPIYNHNWRNIITIYIDITRLASNEIFSPSNKIHREVGRAKDLSAPIYSGADKSLARKGRKKATATEGCDIHIYTCICSWFSPKCLLCSYSKSMGARDLGKCCGLWLWQCGISLCVICDVKYRGVERCAQGFGGEAWWNETIGETQTLDGSIILRWNFRKCEGVVGTGWSGLRIGTGGYGNELWGSINAGNFLTSCKTS
jgi:hypothetical protein